MIKIIVKIGAGDKTFSVQLNPEDLSLYETMTKAFRAVHSSTDMIDSVAKEYMELRMDGHGEDIIFNRMAEITEIWIDSLLLKDSDHPNLSRQGMLKILSGYKYNTIRLAGEIRRTYDIPLGKALEICNKKVYVSSCEEDKYDDFQAFVKDMVTDETTYAYELEDHVNWAGFAEDLMKNQFTEFKVDDEVYILRTSDLKGN